MRKLRVILLCSTVLFLLGISQSALANTDPCPAVGDNAAGTCNIIITIAPNGSITTSAGSATQPYDNVVKSGAGEDVTVGVINNSASAIGALILTGAPTTGDLGPFNFDESTAADAPCDPFLGTTASGCPAEPETIDSAFGFGPGNGCATITGYEGPDNCFSNFATFTTGTVNFLGAGLAANSSTWFALEAPAEDHLTVTTTPEPDTLLLFSTGLALLVLFRFRFFSRASGPCSTWRT